MMITFDQYFVIIVLFKHSTSIFIMIGQWFVIIMIDVQPGLGAKSQNLSSVAPPRKKKLVTIFSEGHVWWPQKPMFY